MFLKSCNLGSHDTERSTKLSSKHSFTILARIESIYFLLEFGQAKKLKIASNTQIGQI